MRETEEIPNCELALTQKENVNNDCFLECLHLVNSRLSCRVDGNLVKRIASGGDEIEVCTNHKDEVHMMLQVTMFLMNNDFPAVEPADAYQTLEVLAFDNVFMPAHEMQSRGDQCPKHWREADLDIKPWIRRTPAVVDAFIKFVLGAYTKDMRVPLESVSRSTEQVAGAASIRDIDRFAEVVRYDPKPNSKVFVGEVQLALEVAGMAGLSTHQISHYIEKLYGGETNAPKHASQLRKVGKKAPGYYNIKLENVVAFNGADERRAGNLRKTEAVRQQARMESAAELGKRTYDEMDESM